MNISKSNIVYILSTGAVILLLVAYVLNRSELTKSKEYITFLEENIQPNKETTYRQMLIHNVKLSSEVYKSYEENKEYWNKEIDRPVLIYRYPEYMCHGCYYENMEGLLQLQKEIGKDRILLLPAYEELRENRIKLKNELEKFNYVNTPFELLAMPEYEYEKAYQQFFAIIDKNKNISMTFFPQLGHKDLTQLYFDEVKSVLSN